MARKGASEEGRHTHHGAARRPTTGEDMPDQLLEALLGAAPAALTQDVSLATPLTLERITGRDRVISALTAYANLFDERSFDLRIDGEELAGGVFSATCDGHLAQIFAVASRDEAGLVSRIDMYGRPWPYMALIRERLAAVDPALVDPDLGTGGYTPEGPGTEKIPGPPVPPLAEDVEFHSPLLTATARGKVANERILTAAAQVYGEATYRAVLQVEEQPAIAVLYDGAIDGNALQVAAIFTLNGQEEVANIRIFSRPWPVTAYLRARMYPLLSDLLGPEYWQGGDPEAPLPIG
jgi:hypothetical protein